MEKVETKVLDKNTSEFNDDNNKRIIKRKWWKVSIIILVIILFLVSLGIGLFFALKKDWNLNSDNIKHDSIKNIRKDIEDGGPKGEGVAIYFFEENDPITNYLMWDDQEGMKSENKGKGILADHIDKTSKTSERSGYTWYAVELKDDNVDEIMKDLFLEQNENTKEWVASENYEGFFSGSGTDFNETNTNSHYVSSAEWTPDGEDKDLNLDLIHDDWSGITITPPEKDSKEQIPTFSWNPKAGTTMWFDPVSKMISSVIDTYVVPESDDDDMKQGLLNMLGTSSGWWSKIEEGKNI